MKKLICGECTLCCVWQEVDIRPVLTAEEVLRLNHIHLKSRVVLAARTNGECTYLDKKGCSIHKDRPMSCRAFDCRELYNDSKEATFIKVLFKGKQMLEEPLSS